MSIYDMTQAYIEATDKTKQQDAFNNFVKNYGYYVGCSADAPDSHKGLLYQVAVVLQKLISDKVLEKTDLLPASLTGLKLYLASGITDYQQFDLTTTLMQLKSSNADQYKAINSVFAGSDEKAVAETMLKGFSSVEGDITKYFDQEDNDSGATALLILLI